MKTATLTIPTIHLNGTSREAIEEPLIEAYDALGIAYDKLKRTAPNARDYYVQGNDAIGFAMGEHMARLQRIDDIRNEIETILGAL